MLRTTVLRFLLTISAIFLMSCEDTPSTPNQSYPTTYRKLSDSALDSLRAQFAAENPGICSTLDEYGFTKFGGSCRSFQGSTCASTDSLAAVVKSILIRNGRFTGLTSSDELRVRWQSCGLAFETSFEFQIYEGMEVFFTGLRVDMDDMGIHGIQGHHYPEIYIPDPVVTPREAEESTLGLSITWYDFAGKPHEYVIDENSFNGEPYRAIYPVFLENEIELHVVWAVQAAGWHVLVDTMTMERIAIQQLFVT